MKVFFQKVKLVKIEKVLNYAIKLVFDDNKYYRDLFRVYITQIGQEYQKTLNP